MCLSVVPAFLIYYVPQAVVRWLNGQEETTHDEQRTLLCLVRYPLLPHGYVMGRVQHEPLVTNHPMGIGLLLESYQQVRDISS